MGFCGNSFLGILRGGKLSSSGDFLALQSEGLVDADSFAHKLAFDR